VYKSLQASRAIAAILVVLLHLGGAIASEKYFGISAFSVPFSFGGSGVSFFFVLSGFIILTVHRKDICRPRMLASYIKKRLIRIYPTYWMIFLSVFFIAILSRSLRNTVPHDIFLVFKSLILIPQNNNAVGVPLVPVIGVAWSLQYEIAFYLFFTLLIINRWISIISGLVMLYLFINYAGVPSLSFPLSFFVSDYIVLFAIEMATSIICTSRKVIVNRPISCIYIGVIMFLLIAMDRLLNINMLYERYTILYGMASSLILFGLVRAEDKGQIIGRHRWLQILGDSSYALYLIHYPLISILCKVSLSLHLNALGVIGAMISYIAIFGACLISSVIFHLRIEEPVMTYLRNARIPFQPSSLVKFSRVSR